MLNISTKHYDPISVTKSRVCALIANSKDVREALNYNGVDSPYPYDPEDPMTLIWNCIIPMKKDPDTITTNEAQVLVGVDAEIDEADPRTLWLFGTIVIVVPNDTQKTDGVYYPRDDLYEEGIVCASRVDYITYEIRQALMSKASTTWIGEIEFTSSQEAPLNYGAHYARTIQFKVRDINDAYRGN